MPKANWCLGHGRTRWQMPFEQNIKLTGRRELLGDLKRRVEQKSDSTKKIAVIGLGGVDKIQIVL